ncbi:DUF4124 domain-containing protein [Vibrio sp. 99-70-13A1]|uniref:DUF4124 domain-containing protein n=1 Tax=Vibrio sp. 99-70-13A1 TaxID=2607601 RepID=UPI0014935B6F|nr:DUF4124 domain-containing protein [Vibrio sp. 99-70-13A1]NOH96169.1 DUF4124 domain-containing protein [Vibrio sp. 99-70-13A1]
MKQILILLGLAFAIPTIHVATLAHAQTVYTWEDENGVLHFSDSPIQSAKQITLPKLEASAPAPKFESSTPVDPPKKDTPQKTVKKKDKPAKVQELMLTMLSPQHDETIRSNRGNLTIQIELNRKLGIGEQLQLILDGRRYGAPQTQATWQLKNIDRGTHTLSIQAHRSGKLIASTSPVTVFLHRATIK